MTVGETPEQRRVRKEEEIRKLAVEAKQPPASRHRIAMIRDPETHGVIRFVGETEEGRTISVVIPRHHWEILGEPGEFVLRVRGR